MAAIDRISPSIRPTLSSSGRQRWDELLFAHWKVEAGLLRDLVPDELELDLYKGDAWVGVVPFLMRDIRPWWLPKWMAFNFLETNLRTYVHHRGVPGVYFHSLEASSYLAVKAARALWSLPYWHAEMQSARDGERISYHSTRTKGLGSLDVEYEIGEELGPSQPGTFEHFLLERYYLFTTRRGKLLQGQVHHTPYPAFEAQVTTIDESLFAAVGLPPTSRPPDVVHYSPGVSVEMFGPWPVNTPSD
jgi:hypothetical protein